MQIATSMLSTLSMFFRTAWLREIGGWDERLAVWQDWELGVRALLHHPRMRWLTQKAYHEIMLHENSITGASPTTRWKAALNTMRIARDTIMQAASATSFNPSPCLRALCLRAYIHAGLLSREGCQEGARAFYAFARQVHSTPSFRLRLLGTVLQHYTALGGRGAWRIMCALLS
jgi:GT2 family glycosyltransferase